PAPGRASPREPRDATPAARAREVREVQKREKSGERVRGRAGQRMARVYSEPVEVQAREDGRPVRFAWRSRLYAVIAVQEHWMVTRDWWRESAPVPARPELQFWRVEASTGPGPPAGTLALRRGLAPRHRTPPR